MSSCFTDISELDSEISLKLLKLFISVQACMFCGCSPHFVPSYLHFTWMVCELCALVYKNHSIWKFFNCFTLKRTWPINIDSATLSLSSVCNIPLVAVSQEVANMTQWKVTLWDLTLPHQQEIVTNQCIGGGWCHLLQGQTLLFEFLTLKLRGLCSTKLLATKFKST